MKKTVIDARGQLCPKPLIMTKKALESADTASTFELLLDNETSRENVERFLLDNSIDYFSNEKDGSYILTISKAGEPVLTSDPEEYCSPVISKGNSSAGYVMCFKSDRMGAGEDELGAILAKACINTIKEISPQPEKIIFYNSGVRLVRDDSPSAGALRELDREGIEILVCGTCADFFNIKNRLAAGKISNMYDILETLASASKVIYP